jgi:hypothetical protein
VEPSYAPDILPPSFLLMIAAILVLYVAMAEAAKAVFYKHARF